MAEYIRNLDKPCPKCRQMTLSCTFDDGVESVGDSTFVFEHRCSTVGCDYHESRSHHVCHGYDTRHDYDCDFCDWNWLSELTRVVGEDKKRHRIFVAHAQPDREFARQLARNLRKSEVIEAVLFDENVLEPAWHVQERIQDEIQRCSLCLFVVGRLGATRWLVEELRFALRLKIRLIVVVHPEAPQDAIASLREIGVPILPADADYLVRYIRDSESSLSYQAPENLIETPDFRIRIASLAEQMQLAVHGDPDALMKLNSRQFEQLIAELMENEGYEVTLTRATRDGGVDIYAVKSDRGARFLTIVDCKHYKKSRRVGIELVRTMYGTLRIEEASHAMIATTTTFTSGARTFETEHKFSISLRDHADIYRWLHPSVRILG